MEEVNFLSTKDDQQNKKDKKEKRDDFEWSKPEENGKKEEKNSPFGWLNFFNKNNKRPPKIKKSAVDKSKLKNSRKEILRLIKEHDSDQKGGEKVKGGKWKLFFAGEKTKNKDKAALVDYQQIFNEERDKRKKAVPLKAETVKESGVSFKKDEKVLEKRDRKKDKAIWLNKLNDIWKKFFKKTAKEDKGDSVKEHLALDEKPTLHISEKNLKESREEPKEEVTMPEKKKEAEEWENPEILDANLIRGEVVTFFDWHKKISALVSTILLTCLAVGFVFGGLIIFQKQEEKQNQGLTEKLNKLQLDIREAEEDVNEILAFQKKLEIASVLLKNHIYWTNFFKFLEDNTLKDVYYIDFSGDNKGSYALDAMAKNFDTIAEQIRVMKENEDVVEAKTRRGEVVQQDKDAGSAGVKFGLELLIKPELFIK